MYFDPRPKQNKKDLFDREKELSKFEESIQQSPLTVITGIRRLGKTSLILVGLSNKPSVIIDLRGVAQSREGLYRRIEFGLNEFFKQHSNIWKKIKEQLNRITGVQAMGFGVSVSWGAKKADLVQLLKTLEDFEVILAFDEVQYLRGPVGKELAEVLAHLYDHSKLKMVVTGSEVGLLYDFLGIEKPEAPLYGRHFREVKLSRFNKSLSREFLEKGFEQIGLTVEQELISHACDQLGGIIGWLVNFGLRCQEKGPSSNIVSEVLEDASKLLRAEFNKFLEKHKPGDKRIREVARAIAKGENTWTRIKAYVEAREKATIQDTPLNRAINALLKASYIEKIVDGRNIHYELADPVLAHALLKR